MAQSSILSARLETVAGFVQKGSSVIDVGTDHGLLPVYLAMNGFASRIIASDISIGSLGSARRTAAKYGVVDKISFVEAKGLSGVREQEINTIVIAGLGGETISGILRDAPWTRQNEKRLILQPQTKVPELCDYLRLTGYSLHEARLALDTGKIYVVMLVKGGKSSSELAPELELLVMLMNKKDPLIGRFLDELIEKARRKLDGIGGSGSPEALELALRLSEYIKMREIV